MSAHEKSMPSKKCYSILGCTPLTSIFTPQFSGRSPVDIVTAFSISRGQKTTTLLQQSLIRWVQIRQVQLSHLDTVLDSKCVSLPIQFRQQICLARDTIQKSKCVWLRIQFRKQTCVIRNTVWTENLYYLSGQKYSLHSRPVGL